MKKTVSVLLILILLVSSVPFLAEVEAGDETPTDYTYLYDNFVTLGSYPQSMITDTEILTALSDIETASPPVYHSYNYMVSSNTSGDYAKYCDIDVNGDGIYDFRKVQFSKYRQIETTDGATYLPGSKNWQVTNGYLADCIYYFRYEPLVWRVLDWNTGLAVCESIIDSQAFNNYSYPGDHGAEFNDYDHTHFSDDWQDSSIRTWLATEFYNTAFSENDRIHIKQSVIDGTATGYSFSYQNTKDDVFLLSASEVDSGFAGFDTAEARIASGTDYAKSQGLFVSDDIANIGCSCWLLRSPGSTEENQTKSCDVVTDFGLTAQTKTTKTSNGIRPAIYYKNAVVLGSYPQSLAFGDSTIILLNNAEKEWKSYGYTESANTPGEYMQYCDIDLDDDGRADYRGVRFSKYRPSDTRSDASAEYKSNPFGRYLLDYTEYFKYEPLVWSVLDSSSGLVLSDIVLDSQPYNEFLYEHEGNGYADPAFTTYSNKWESSSLRKWLNETFYDTAFSDEEKTHIRLTEIANAGADGSFAYGSTADNIFLLSHEDVLNPRYGFSSDPAFADSARTPVGRSAYSICQGLENNLDPNTATWSLRSPAVASFLHETVLFDGTLVSAYSTTSSTFRGIRPSFCYSENPLVPQSYAPGCVHETEEVPFKAAAKYSAGNNAYYVCRLCGRAFSDAECMTLTTPENEFIPPLSLPGDVSGDGAVRTDDVRTALRHIAGENREFEYEAADLDRDGEVTAWEVRYMLMVAVGREEQPYSAVASPAPCTTRKADSKRSVKLSSDGTIADSGEFTVSVGFNGMSSLSAMSLGISYDASVVEFVGNKSMTGSGIAVLPGTDTDENGTVRIGLICEDKLGSDNESIELRFRFVDSAEKTVFSVTDEKFWFTDPSATDYSVNNLSFQGRVEASVQYGDVNEDGEINASDVRLALRRAAGEDDGYNYIHADLNTDGQVSAWEAMYILRMAVRRSDYVDDFVVEPEPCTNQNGAAEAGIYLSSDNVISDDGEFRIVIHFENLDYLTAASFDLSFDSGNLEYTGCVDDFGTGMAVVSHDSLNTDYLHVAMMGVDSLFALNESKSMTLTFRYTKPVRSAYFYVLHEKIWSYYDNIEGYYLKGFTFTDTSVPAPEDPSASAS